MPDEPIASVAETFSAPIEHLIVSLAQSLAEAQKALDENSIAMQQQLDSDPVLAKYGLQATWFQFPKVDFQLKLAVSIAKQGTTPSSPQPGAPPGAPAPLVASSLLQSARFISLHAQPVSASYQTQFQYDASAASVLSLSIVPVPPPRPSDQGTTPALLHSSEVQTKALAMGAKFQVDQKGNPVSSLRFEILFNSSARTWYVIQYDPATPSGPSVVVAVDDVTGIARVISTS